MTDEEEDCVPNDADCSFCKQIKECKVHEKTKVKERKGMRMVRRVLPMQDAAK